MGFDVFVDVTCIQKNCYLQKKGAGNLFPTPTERKTDDYGVMFPALPTE